MGSVAVSAVSTDVLPYISVAIKATFLKLGMCNICKNNISKMFLDFFKFKIVHLIEVFKIFDKKSSARGISKTAGWIFTKFCTAGTSKLIDVQCKFMFKSDHKILSCGHFKILTRTILPRVR